MDSLANRLIIGAASFAPVLERLAVRGFFGSSPLRRDVGMSDAFKTPRME